MTLLLRLTKTRPNSKQPIVFLFTKSAVFTNTLDGHLIIMCAAGCSY